MFLEVFFNYSLILSKYFVLYAYFYTLGKFVFYKILKFTKEKEKISNLLYVKKEYFYPFLGVVVLGNLLVVYNFFFPLKSSELLLYSIFVISLSAFKKFNFEYKNLLKFDNIFSYLIIPSILIISIYDTAFNFDAGYYSIPNQNWLRESNLIIGIVNIYWELGMLSITEYISSVLWFDSSFVLLHLLNIYFIHFFYLLIKEFILNNFDQALKNVSIFLIVFSILDNFGFGGGRNGFLYIEGVTKQDVPVGILFWFLSLIIIKKILDKNIKDYEILVISLSSFFIFQIKVSSVFVLLIYSLLLIYLITMKSYSLKKIFYINSPVLVLVISWFTKNFLTTGCLVYPLNITCINSFDWYIEGSTRIYEELVKSQSQTFDFSIPFNQWVLQTGSFEVRKQVVLNFAISLIILYFIKLLYFHSIKTKKMIFVICLSYISLNLLYLFFYSPIPRYFIGICLFIVSMLGLFAGEPKFRISKFSIFSLIFLSVFLLVKSTSYTSLLSNNELRIFDPRSNPEIEYIQISTNWVRPQDENLQCWANIKCVPSGNGVTFEKIGIFKTAFKR